MSDWHNTIDNPYRDDMRPPYKSLLTGIPDSNSGHLCVDPENCPTKATSL